jgi:hypothetical protein
MAHFNPISCEFIWERYMNSMYSLTVLKELYIFHTYFNICQGIQWVEPMRPHVTWLLLFGSYGAKHPNRNHLMFEWSFGKCNKDRPKWGLIPKYVVVVSICNYLVLYWSSRRLCNGILTSHKTSNTQITESLVCLLRYQSSHISWQELSICYELPCFNHRLMHYANTIGLKHLT